MIGVTASRLRILLIDDSTAYQDEFAELLAAGPFADAALECVSNAREGARLLQCNAHSIYFVDYRLPGDTGIALIEAARRGGVDRPIILLTGYDSPQIDTAAEQAGANDYLPKGGFSASALSRTIRYALRNTASVLAVREAENRFRMAQEAADIGTWDYDLISGARIWSGRMRAMFGLDPESVAPISHRTSYQTVHRHDRRALRAVIAASIAAVAPFETRFRVAPAGRPVRWLACKGMVMRSPEGAATRVVGVTVDVTEQQNALTDLRTSRNTAIADREAAENLFQTYFENALDGLFHARLAPDGRFVFEAINAAALAGSHTTPAAARGGTPEAVLGAERGASVTAALRRVRETGTPCRHETEIGRLTLDGFYLPLRNRDGMIDGVLGSLRDISNRRRLEEALRQAQRMEVMGQIAGGVAHDFNNILQTIHGCLELVLDTVPAGAQTRDFIIEGLQSVARGSDLTHHLLAYARKEALRPQIIALPPLLAEIETHLTETMASMLAITMNLVQPLPPILADPAQLRTALLNLAMNAADAMPQGGQISLSAHAMMEEGATWVAISVTDTGTGMDKATLARCTEPFFTNNGQDGTGLGLSMVQGFAAQSGGRLRIASELGQGTTVELQLPTAGGRRVI